MTPAVIIGNGESRRKFDLRSLENHETYGCNAIWREFVPKNIVSIDPMPIYELMSSGNVAAISSFLPTPYDAQYEPEVANPDRPRNNAGMVAMQKAISHGYLHLIIIGMDFFIDDPRMADGNMFAGTFGYGADTKCTYEDTHARWRFMEWFARAHPNVLFEFVFPEFYNFRMTTVPNIKVSINATIPI